MKQIALKDILSPEQLNKCHELINSKDKQGLRAYLKTIEQDLSKKEILPDYLYYLLCWISKLH